MLILSIFNASATFKKFIVFRGKCGNFARIYLYAKKNMSCRGTPSDTTVAERGTDNLCKTVQRGICVRQSASKDASRHGQNTRKTAFAVCIHRKVEEDSCMGLHEAETCWNILDPTHKKKWCCLWDLRRQKDRILPDCTVYASKSALDTFPSDRRMDKCFLLQWVWVWVWPMMMEKWAISWYTDLKAMLTWAPAINWTVIGYFQQLVRSLYLHFACLVIFSPMQSQPAIQRSTSDFHRPETSYLHVNILWHR